MKNSQLKLKSTISLLAMMLLTACGNQNELELSKTSEVNRDCSKQSKTNADGCNQQLNLHLQSPEWQDQIIYFLMIDRFNDGDPANNDQGLAEFDPSRGSHFSGGDIRGITEKLDYIQKLGATSIWITPPVANQWWSNTKEFSGYHGYWAIDFKKIDQHFGKLVDYQQLSHQLHNRGMYLIQDIVTNHTGNFFEYKGQYDANNTQQNFILSNSLNTFQWAPVQYPFNLIDRNNPKHQQADIYHWTPIISDYNDPQQESNYQLAGLADLNTTNPRVRSALKNSYRYWIETVGVDGFRVDTVKFVEHDFWNDFINSGDGIFEAAKATGRENFLAFGEVFEISPEQSDAAEIKIASYLGSVEKPELNSVIGFPLYGELSRVFALGRPTENLAYRIRKQMEIYKDPYIIPNFVDNHDTQRFLADGSLDALKQALFTIFTIPGIPVIYQGTEQALVETRAAMFAGGYHASEENFNTNSEMFTFIKRLADFRKSNEIYSRGTIDIVATDQSGAGLLAYKRNYKNKQVLVIVNSSDREKLVSQLNTGFPSGSIINTIFSENIDASMKQYQLTNNSTLTLVLPARAMLVVKAVELDEPKQADSEQNIEISVNQDFSHKTLIEDTLISGKINRSNTPLHLVINGDLNSSITFSSNKSGLWQVKLPVSRLGYHQNYFSIYSTELKIASEEYQYATNLKTAEIEIVVNDPDNDAVGPSGSYSAPQNENSQNQLEMKQIKVRTAGDILELSINMKQISTFWAPNNGFDNVSFSLFFSIPGKDGVTSLPDLNMNFPHHLKWSIGHVFYGWGNSIFSSENATLKHSGKKLAAAPEIIVDKEKKLIRITYTGQSLGVENWAGSSIYVSTWDKTGEGEYRPLTADGGQWEFSGGDLNSPKIMDDLFITISAPNKFKNNNI